MNNRNNDGRHDYGAGQQDLGRQAPRQGSGQFRDPSGEQSFGQSQEPRGGRGVPGNRSRGEYYGGAQFGERTQHATGWDEEGSEWSYEGGPERFSTSGYSEGNLRASGGYQGDLSQSQRQTVGQYGRQPYGQGPDPYGLHRAPQMRDRNQWSGSDYYAGRQGYGPQDAHGGDYNTYGRNQGYGEGSAYTRQNTPYAGARDRYPGARQQVNPAWRENANFGGQGPRYGGQDYLDEGEMSGYRGTRELSTQEYGSRSSGRYGTEPGQYGYGGYGQAGRGFRGLGPKNYARSDERLTEDLNERLTDDDDLDASEITVRVADGKVTLEGSVDQRWMKHRAEDIADACSGVREVDNRIIVTQSSSELGGAARTGARGAPGRTTGASTGGTSTGASSQTSPNPGSSGTH